LFNLDRFNVGHNGSETSISIYLHFYDYMKKLIPKFKTKTKKQFLYENFFCLINILSLRDDYWDWYWSNWNIVVRPHNLLRLKTHTWFDCVIPSRWLEVNIPKIDVNLLKWGTLGNEGIQARRKKKGSRLKKGNDFLQIL